MATTGASTTRQAPGAVPPNVAVPSQSDAADQGGRVGGRTAASTPPRSSPGSHRQHHRSAPGRAMRHRAGRDVSSSSRGGRHVTNINRINVINNYGVADGGTGNYFSTPWKRERRARERLGWGALRVALALLLLLWFVMMLSVMRSSAPLQLQHQQRPSSSHGVVSAKSQRLKRLDEHPAVGFLEKVNGANGSAAEDEGEGGAKGELNGSGKSPPREDEKKEHHSVFELSMFGNTSPSDFQRYTPDAPSCSRPLEASSVSYTLVSQLSNDRIWMVPYHCLRWGDNPMSIVIFTDRSANDVKSQLVSKGCHADNLAVRTVGTKYDPTGTEYPVNLLRNMALSAVRTSHVVYADIDFWPSSDLLSILSGEAIRERFAYDPKLATVIPVFQMSRRCKEYMDCRGDNIPYMPRNKAALLSLIKKKQASTFDPTNVGGHGSTKYITWRDQEEGTFVDLPCVKSNRYEPYLVFRYCDSLPPFQEGFTGYGKNKMTWAMQLRRSGYLFSQIGGAFLVHYPHLDSKARLEWNKKPRAMEKYGYSAKHLLEDKENDINWKSYKRARIDALFLDFKEWLDGTVEDESRVPICKDALNDDVRLWVHQGRGGSDDEEEEEDGEEADGEDEDDEGMEAEVGEKESYDEFVHYKRVYNECLEENSNDSGECFKAASDFIEMSILWSLEGGMSGRLDPLGERKVLAEAERCAAPLLPLHRDDGDKDSKDYSFQKLVATLYVNRGRVERSLHNTARAIEYASKAVELNPGANDARQLLSKLLGRGNVSHKAAEREEDSSILQSPGDRTKVGIYGETEEK